MAGLGVSDFRAWDKRDEKSRYDCSCEWLGCGSQGSRDEGMGCENYSHVQLKT